MDKKKAAQIIYDRDVNGLSYRNLGIKYGMAHAGIYAMLNKKNKRQVKVPPTVAVPGGPSPDDIPALKEELRRERLKNALLNNVIDIASKELGVDIRKKSGTRRSE